MQSLFVGDNQWVKIDRKFVDGGTPAKMGLVGGLAMELAPAIPPQPSILMARGGFYYEDRSPVTTPEHVAYLPKPYREQAEKWIKAQGGKAKPLPLVTGQVTEQGQPIPPDRGRSLRGQAPHAITSEEQAERELLGPGGVREVERA